MNDYYVYIYYEPGTAIPIYVGKGRRDRAWIHLQFWSQNKNTPFACKIRNLLKEGYSPQPEILHYNLSESEAYLIEMQLIRQYGCRFDETGTLFNMTYGGEGVSGAQWHLNSNQKLAISKRMLGNANGEGNTGKKYLTGNWNSKRRRIVCLYSENGPIKKIYDFVTEVREEGFHHSAVSMCLNQKREKAYSYFWKYYSSVNSRLIDEFEQKQINQFAGGLL